jgi:hypothetical protein
LLSKQSASFIDNNDTILDNFNEIIDFFDPNDLSSVDVNNNNDSHNNLVSECRLDLPKQTYDNSFMDELDEFTTNIHTDTDVSFGANAFTASQTANTMLSTAHDTTEGKLPNENCFFTQDVLSNLLFEAMDGFYFILNLNGTIEAIGDTVSFYTKFAPVGFFLLLLFWNTIW